MNEFIVFLILFSAFLLTIQRAGLSQAVKNTIMINTCYVVFFALLGFRSIEVLPDTYGYCMHFQDIVSIRPFYEINPYDRFGKGYLYFEQFIHNHISEKFLVYNLITTFIILFSVFHFFRRYSKHITLTLFLFVFTKLVFNEAIALRQGLAMSILLLSHRFLEERSIPNMIKYILCVSLATTFHNSAIVMFALLLFRGLENKPKIVYGIIGFISIFTFFFFESVMIEYWGISEKSQYMKDLVAGYNMVGIAAFLSFLSLVIFLFYSRKYVSNECQKKNDIFFFASIFLMLLLLLSIRSFIFTRFSIYLMPYAIVTCSNFYHETWRLGKCKMLFKWAICIVLFNFFIFLLLRPEWTINLPYKFYGQ